MRSWRSGPTVDLNRVHWWRPPRRPFWKLRSERCAIDDPRFNTTVWIRGAFCASPLLVMTALFTVTDELFGRIFIQHEPVAYSF